MDLRINHLKSFVAVARLGSFTRAAGLLHLSQPALTVQIQQLEEFLGVRLLDRNTRSVKLTPSGKRLAPAAQRMIKELEGFVATAKSLTAQDKGSVHIAAIASASAPILPTAVAQFNERYPGISVRITETSTERIINMVREESVDFGIASLAAVPTDIQKLFLFRDRLSAVFAPKLALGRKNPIGLKDLVHFPLILMEPETSNRRIIDRAFEELGYSAKPAFEVNRTMTALALAEAGLGVAILSASLVRRKRQYRVQVRPIYHPILAREIYALQKFGRTSSLETIGFLKVLLAVTRSSGLDTRQTT
jgi:LysR family transcriptional regulator, carnitine catabolism transcriptional activator